MGDRVLIFANPIAGRGRGKRIAQALKQRFTRSAAVEVDVFTDRIEDVDVTSLRRESIAAIVVGGDGTLRSVAEQLVRVFPVSQFPPLLVVPLGTANLMGKHLGIDWHSRDFEDDVVGAIRRGQVVHLDAARANGRLFLLMAGVGIDGAIVHELARVRKGPIDYLSYALPAALALRDYSYPALRVIVDGKEVFRQRPGMAFVGNVKEYGTGFPILPDARSDDGLLDVCVLPCRSPQEALQLALRAVTGEHMQVEGVVYTKGRRIRIESPQEVPVQVDGDASGHTPVDIDLLPIQLPFIVP